MKCADGYVLYGTRSFRAITRATNNCSAVDVAERSAVFMDRWLRGFTHWDTAIKYYVIRSPWPWSGAKFVPKLLSLKAAVNRWSRTYAHEVTGSHSDCHLHISQESQPASQKDLRPKLLRTATPRVTVNIHNDAQQWEGSRARVAPGTSVARGNQHGALFGGSFILNTERFIS
jgi:hypothetical protein